MTADGMPKDTSEAAVAQTGSAPAPRAQAAEHRREKFIPVTRHALLDRLTAPALWPKGDHREARRFLRYLDYWRRHSYSAKLLDLEQLYEPFSPDTDLLQTRSFTAEERQIMQKRLVAHMDELLTQGNFTRVDADQFHLILTTDDSHYGLDLQVDTDDFEELLIFYRGATEVVERHRDPMKAYLAWREVKVPVYQRLFILFKLKPFEKRVQELLEAPMPDKKKPLDRKRAEAIVRRQRKMLPETVLSDYIYIKLFKNIPRTDLEMAFPNTEVRFRLLDKIKLGLTASSGVGAGVVGTATKLAMISNPYTLVMALAGLGGVAARQVSNFINQRNRYMQVLAKNLYFHSMADNRGVMTLLADRAADEDIKEEMLLYTAIANVRFKVHDLKTIDEGIEGYLSQTFGVKVDFDVSDALERLQKEQIVTVLEDGTLRTLPPPEAALHIDKLWDACLDQLPDITTTGEGQEIER
jgi:hypothetical protein